jgi:perosamine synthetase
MIPYGRQSVSEADIDAVIAVLRGDWLTQGPTIERFESAVAERVGAKFAVAYSSGTSALHGATWAAGLGPGDVVATSPLTFMASANCARYVGATPALVDIDPVTWNMDVSKIPAGLSGLVAVHYAGLPMDLGAIPASVRPRVVIEDAAHALGAEAPEGPVGNCHYSDMTCFSFHPVKPITTGEGGMVTTNNSELADRLRRFRSHGIVRKPERGEWFYEISDVGFNYRMTDLQAALGLSQLDKLESFIIRRNEIASVYRDSLKELAVCLPAEAPAGFRHAYHLFPVLVRDRDRVFAELRNNQVGVQVHYVPVHHHPVSVDVSIPQEGLPVCDWVFSRVFSLPIFPSLQMQSLTRVISLLVGLLEKRVGDSGDSWEDAV